MPDAAHITHFILFYFIPLNIPWTETSASRFDEALVPVVTSPVSFSLPLSLQRHHRNRFLLHSRSPDSYRRQRLCELPSVTLR